MTKNKILNNITSESLKTEENSIKEILSTSVSTLSNFDTDIENIRIETIDIICIPSSNTIALTYKSSFIPVAFLSTK